MATDTRHMMAPYCKVSSSGRRAVRSERIHQRKLAVRWRAKRAARLWRPNATAD
jgi:hypothetical protein